MQRNKRKCILKVPVENNVRSPLFWEDTDKGKSETQV